MENLAWQTELFTPGAQIIPFPAKAKQQPELTVLSFGGGQDSTAILDLLVFDKGFRRRYAPGRLLVVMADTGDEHPATVAHTAYIKQFCEKHGVEFVLITPDMGFHSEKWTDLRGFYRRTNTVGSKAFPKTCTDKLKLVPIYRFLESWLGTHYGVQVGRKKGFREFVEAYGKIRVLIGIAKGEEKRMAAPGMDAQPWKRDCIETEYPLVDRGMDRQACQDYIRSVGEPVPFPSNCILCPFMNEIEMLWLYRFMHADYLDWVEIERNKLEANRHMGEKNLGVWGKKTLPEKMAEVLTKHGHMSDEELNTYKMSHGHCVMSKY